MKQSKLLSTQKNKALFVPSRYCTFPFAGADEQHFASEIMYTQAKIDGCERWKYRTHLRHRRVSFQQIRELRFVRAMLMARFPTVTALEDFCIAYAEDLRNGYEYNLYWDGEQCNYWIHCRMEPSNTNFTVHAIKKEKEKVKYGT